jgi:hypothetical protein
MKESLGFPQTYIISTKYKTQQQMKERLGFPQTYIIIYACGKPRGSFICFCILYFVQMIYICGKPRGCFICCCVSTKYKTQQQMKQSLGFPQTYIISTKYKNK